MFFYVSKLLFSGFLQFKVNFVRIPFWTRDLFVLFQLHCGFDFDFESIVYFYINIFDEVLYIRRNKATNLLRTEDNGSW